MLEYEKFQELQGKSQRMQEDYERQLSEMEEKKEQALEELTEYYETKLLELTTKLEQVSLMFSLFSSLMKFISHELGERQNLMICLILDNV